MHVYFSVDQRLHGVGPVKYAWDPTGNFLASTGSSRVVHIFDRRGELVDQIVPPSPSICTHVAWSNSRDHKVHGLTLAVTQANSSVLVLWSASTQTTQHVDVGVKEITLLLWNKGKSTTMEGGEDNSVLLAIGTSKGQVVFYDMDDLAARAPSQQRVNVRTALSKHKKKILCGDWNSQNEFAFGSEDRQVSICYGKDGSVVDQVKIKAAPVGIQFGGRQSSGVKRIVSVNMGRETILLYDLNEKDNALELAFQARYGDIVDYRWFGAGYIIAGFSVGYVVVISTHMNEIGQEQYCAKFHDNWLHAICYNEINGMVATCGDACIKVVRMVDWKDSIKLAAAEDMVHKNTQQSYGTTKPGVALMHQAQQAHRSNDAEASRVIHIAKNGHASEAHLDNGGHIKSAVYGGLDGIITTFATVTSVAGSGLPHSVILILGLAHLVADGLSMGMGDVLSSQAEIDLVHHE
ncbi:hypothetical protein DYB32_005472, partial [Aphanomyces invadans]